MTLMKPAFFCALLLFALTSEASVVESFPEFRSLTEEEEQVLEGPWRLNPDYQITLLSYRRPPAAVAEFVAKPNAFDAGLGSLNGSQFMVRDRLKLRAAFKDALEFRFSWLSEQDLEDDATHAMLEVIFWPAPALGLGLAAYGDPDLYKRKNDTGLALLWRGSGHEIRLFNTFVDVTRQKRSDRPDHFVEPELPYARGIVGRHWWAGQFIQYAFRYETRTRWTFPLDAYEYEFWRATASFEAFLRASERVSWLFEGQFDQKHEARLPGASSIVAAADLGRTRRVLRAEAWCSSLGPRGDWTVVAGLDWASRRWEHSLGVATMVDWIPHVALHIPAFGSDLWRMEILSSFHRQSGPAALFSNEPSSPWLHKLVLAYDFRFMDKGSLSLIATGDLGRYGTRKAWGGGGGNVNLRLNF